MRDSNVANAAKESTQREFSHGLLDLCVSAPHVGQNRVAQIKHALDASAGLS
jgi:hypothetical protein